MQDADIGIARAFATMLHELLELVVDVHGRCPSRFGSRALRRRVGRAGDCKRAEHDVRHEARDVAAPLRDLLDQLEDRKE